MNREGVNSKLLEKQSEMWEKIGLTLSRAAEKSRKIRNENHPVDFAGRKLSVHLSRTSVKW